MNSAIYGMVDLELEEFGRVKIPRKDVSKLCLCCDSPATQKVVVRLCDVCAAAPSEAIRLIIGDLQDAADQYDSLATIIDPVKS